jgi:STE20-like kinase
MRAAREAAIWELEEEHLNEKTNLARRQLKDLFFLKRHQMMTRHGKVTCEFYSVFVHV